MKRALLGILMALVLLAPVACWDIQGPGPEKTPAEKCPDTGGSWEEGTQHCEYPFGIPAGT
jgi:hypothetical protein